MKIAIIGAGFTGLAAAHALSKLGHDISVFEMDREPGGLAIGYQEKGWEWTLEKHYHHWFTNDESILALAKEIGYEVVITRPKTSSFVDKEILQLDSPLSLLRFPKLTLLERLRMATTLGILRFDPFWKPLEALKASDILPKAMGRRAYEMLWEPLLLNKFGAYADDISLAWFWARIKKRTTSLAYPTGGFLPFAKHLAKTVTTNGVSIYYETAVTEIDEKKNELRLTLKQKISVKKETFDKVIVTLPGFQFTKLAPHLPDRYKKQLLSLKGLGAVNIVVRMNKQFFKDNTYWLSICEKNAPVLAIVEHTNFMDKSHYNDEHLLYLGNYLPMDHKYFTESKENVLKEMLPFISAINPHFQRSIIAFEKFTAPFAQPIIPTHYSRLVPPFETPIKNVFLANMQQVYPWDRGTNYAVELGEKVAKRIMQS